MSKRNPKRLLDPAHHGSEKYLLPPQRDIDWLIGIFEGRSNRSYVSNPVKKPHCNCSGEWIEVKISITHQCKSCGRLAVYK